MRWPSLLLVLYRRGGYAMTVFPGQRGVDGLLHTTNVLVSSHHIAARGGGLLLLMMLWYCSCRGPKRAGFEFSPRACLAHPVHTVSPEAEGIPGRRSAHWLAVNATIENRRGVGELFSLAGSGWLWLALALALARLVTSHLAILPSLASFRVCLRPQGCRPFSAASASAARLPLDLSDLDSGLAAASERASEQTREGGLFRIEPSIHACMI